LSLLPDHAQTTLVRYILNERHGFRIAVILNEYGGETGLESAFVQDEQVRPWVTLLGAVMLFLVLPGMGSQSWVVDPDPLKEGSRPHASSQSAVPMSAGMAYTDC
jgi:hypothetical protein